jgi:hypothetical protein
VVSQSSLQQYQLLMKHLFELELCERALHNTWRVYQTTRPLFKCVADLPDMRALGVLGDVIGSGIRALDDGLCSAFLSIFRVWSSTSTALPTCFR